MDVGGRTVPPDTLEAAARILGDTVRSSLARLAIEERAHGTRIAFAGAGAARRRVLEVDRGGTLLAAARWRDDGALGEAALRIPDGRWLTIEPRAVHGAWGLSDRLWLGDRPGRDGAMPIVELAAVDYAGAATIPVLAEPARLPRGGGTTVLNWIASLAADAGRHALRYRGPYPGEELFLSLLESFRYDTAADDPLAAFMEGALAWEPAPNERLVERDGITVQLRERVEKVTWQGRTYYRPDWQGVARHTARRVRDVAGDVVCSLWALAAPLADHLTLRLDGAVVDVVAPVAEDEASRPVAAPIVAAIVTAVAAMSVPALAPFVKDAARAVTLEWGAVPLDLVAARDGRLRLSSRLRAAAAARVVALPDRRARVTLAVALLGEIAALVGDTLRARAQAALAALPARAQEAALAVTEHPDRAASAVAIAEGTDALLGELEDRP
ncbi:MAG: hypothetical protein HYU41_16980 [Candidatus Rokubacteria bacterium]|nr:hypothetical protein [Candidatus Rokubacteria bacterium]